MLKIILALVVRQPRFVSFILFSFGLCLSSAPYTIRFEDVKPGSLDLPLTMHVELEGDQSILKGGAFTNRLEAAITSEYIASHFGYQTTIEAVDPLQRGYRTKLANLLPPVFEEMGRYAQQDKDNIVAANAEIEQIITACREGQISWDSFYEYALALHDDHPGKGKAMLALGYRFSTIDREQSAAYFKAVADGNYYVTDHDRIDAMRNYARFLHYYIPDRRALQDDTAVQQWYAQNNYQSYLALQQIKKYIHVAPEVQDMQKAFFAEINQELIAIMLERARCEKIPLNEVRSEAEILIKEIPEENYLHRQTCRLMALETFVYEREYEKLLEAIKGYYELEPQIDTRPYWMVRYWEGWAHGHLKNYQDAIGVFKEVINYVGEGYRDFHPAVMGYLKLTELHLLLEMGEDAAKYLSKLKDSFPEVFSTLQLTDSPAFDFLAAHQILRDRKYSAPEDKIEGWK